MEAHTPKVVWLSQRQPASIALAVDDVRETYQRQFGSNLVFLRAQARIANQPKLAELVGVSTSTVQRWESGGNLPDVWELRKLSDVLGVTIEELVEPEPMTERERLLARRAARGVHQVGRRVRKG